MNIVTTCPCCSNPMLHHFRDRGEYWFCRKCWQEMPNLSVIKEHHGISRNKIVNLSDNLLKRNKVITV